MKHHLRVHEIKAPMNDKPAIIDGRRIIDPHKAKNIGFTYYGIGFGAQINEKE